MPRLSKVWDVQVLELEWSFSYCSSIRSLAGNLYAKLRTHGIWPVSDHAIHCPAINNCMCQIHIIVIIVYFIDIFRKKSSEHF